MVGFDTSTHRVFTAEIGLNQGLSEAEALFLFALKSARRRLLVIMGIIGRARGIHIRTRYKM